MPGCKSDRDLNLLAAWKRIPKTAHDPFWIAVVDKGVEMGPEYCPTVHPERPPTPECFPFFDIVLDAQNNLSGSENRDPIGHGTKVASIIGARADNGIALAGVMPGTRIVSCKAGGTEDPSPGPVAACLHWINDLVRTRQYNIVAVNLSIGEAFCSPAIETEIRELRRNRVLVIAAAGNNSGDNDSPASCPIFPASFPVSNVISVAASNFDDLIGGRSGKRSVHVTAPVHEGSSKAEIPAIDPNPTPAQRENSLRGTSAATALVSGLVALLKAQVPARDWITLRNLVLAGGVPVSSLRDKTITGRRVCAADTGGLGSMTCNNQIVQRRLLPRADRLEMKNDEDNLRIVELSINCASPLPPPPVEVRMGNQRWLLPLADEGEGGDEVEDDGEYAALWTPPVRGADYVLKFANSADDLSVHVK